MAIGESLFFNSQDNYCSAISTSIDTKIKTTRAIILSTLKPEILVQGTLVTKLSETRKALKPGRKKGSKNAKNHI